MNTKTYSTSACDFDWEVNTTATYNPITTTVGTPIYTPVTVTTPYISVNYPARYQPIIEELKPSSKFEKGQIVKLLYNTSLNFDEYGIVHEAYNDFCIVIFDFKFYKVDSSCLVDAFNE